MWSRIVASSTILGGPGSGFSKAGPLQSLIHMNFVKRGRVRYRSVLSGEALFGAPFGAMQSFVYNLISVRYCAVWSRIVWFRAVKYCEGLRFAEPAIILFIKIRLRYVA